MKGHKLSIRVQNSPAAKCFHTVKPETYICYISLPYRRKLWLNIGGLSSDYMHTYMYVHAVNGSQWLDWTTITHICTHKHKKIHKILSVDSFGNNRKHLHFEVKQSRYIHTRFFHLRYNLTLHYLLTYLHNIEYLESRADKEVYPAPGPAVTVGFFKPDSDLWCLPAEPSVDDGSERQLAVLAVLRAVSLPMSAFCQNIHTCVCNTTEKCALF